MEAALIILGVVFIVVVFWPRKEWTTITVKSPPYKPGNPYPY